MRANNLLVLSHEQVVAPYEADKRFLKDTFPQKGVLQNAIGMVKHLVVYGVDEPVLVKSRVIISPLKFVIEGRLFRIPLAIDIHQRGLDAPPVRQP